LQHNKYGVSGYFLADKVVNYFDVKRCSKSLVMAVFYCCDSFSTATFGFKSAYQAQSFGLVFMMRRSTIGFMTKAVIKVMSINDGGYRWC